MTGSEKPIQLITHSGRFHTDDVFAIAALTMLVGDQYEIVRTRDPEVMRTGDYVVDVGDVYDPNTNRFDHHQAGGAGERENGIPYSSLGLVWKHYGTELCNGNEEAAHVIDKRLCQPIDAGDNGIEVFSQNIEGVFPYLIQGVTAAYRPTWREGEDKYDDAFMELVGIARGILKREIIVACDEVAGWGYVEEAYQNAEDKRIIVLNDHYPWIEVLAKYPEPLYVVKKGRQRDEWKVECVREDVHTFEYRKSLPESWAGKRDEDLAEVTGVPDAKMCHNLRFIAVAKSKEGALTLAQKAVEA